MNEFENKAETGYEDESKGLEMFFDPEVAEKFADLEQNQKNYDVANIIDNLAINEIKKPPLLISELGGGAHPDRYHQMFDRLLSDKNNVVDWVDISPTMLELAKEYLDDDKFRNRKEIINILKKDIIKYLSEKSDESIDLVIMKYMLEYFPKIDEIFKLLSQKLKKGSSLVATIGVKDNKLKSYSTNARYLYQGKEFSKDEVKILKDGDAVGVKFFKVSGKPEQGFLKGAEFTKYYHSKEKILKLAEKYHLDAFVGDWKDYLEGHEDDDMDQQVLVLKKK